MTDRLITADARTTTDFDPSRIAELLVDCGAAYWSLSMCFQRKLYWRHNGGVVHFDAGLQGIAQ